MAMAIEWAKLKDPFPPGDIEWRVQNSGMSGEKPWAIVVPYITARGVQERLDEVFTPGGWQCEYRQGPEGGILCRLGARVGGEWIWKEDGAPKTEIEGVKGGYSAAMKRTAVVWGIGRFLYSLTSAQFAAIVESGSRQQCRGKALYSSDIKDKQTKRTVTHIAWNPPVIDWSKISGVSAHPPANKSASAAEKPPANKSASDSDSRSIDDMNLSEKVAHFLRLKRPAVAWLTIQEEIKRASQVSNIGPQSPSQRQRLYAICAEHYPQKENSREVVRAAITKNLGGMELDELPWTVHGALAVIFGADPE